MSITGWVRRTLGFDQPPVSHAFQAGPIGPMPIDQMWQIMLDRSGTVSRWSALQIPGVQKGRNLICSISTLPLVELGPDNMPARSPLLEQIDPNVANVVTLAMTFEDLLFDAISWWQVTARGSDNYPVSCRRVTPGTVSLEPPSGGATGTPQSTWGGELRPDARVVYVDGGPVDARDMKRFDSPNPGLLEFAGPTLRQARLYMEAASLYAANPQPTEHFTAAAGAAEMADEEIASHISEWRAARRAGGTAYVPRALTYVPGTSPSAADQKLVELKQQAALETALLLNLDPELFGIATTTRTYANASDWRRDRINDVFAAYMQAISQRLTMPDMCRRGYIRIFDLDDYMRADPMTRWNVYEKAVGMDAMSIGQVQQEERLPVTGPVGNGPAAGAATDEAAPEPGRDEVAAVRRRRAASFTDTRGDARTFAFRARNFAVDTAARTIGGLAVPYGEVAWQNGQRYRFAPGSLQWGDDVGRVKLLQDHDYGRAIGKALSLTSTDAGLEALFKVGAGPTRDDALQDAADGIVDGLSVGADFSDDDDTVPDPDNPGVLLVTRATLREVSHTAMPAFDGARVSTVTAHREAPEMANTGASIPPAPNGATPPAPPPLPTGAGAAPAAPATVQFSDDSLRAALVAAGWTAPAPAAPAAVAPDGPAGRGQVSGAAVVREASPYRFSRQRNLFVSGGEHDFATDLVAAFKTDRDLNLTPAGRRVAAQLAHTFTIESADINELTPTIQRPDLYVDQRDYRYPLTQAVNKGAPPNGVQPFTFPRFSSSSGLVSDHVEGTEPTSGNLVTTSQTVTPTALSGKASIVREVWDMGGNPAVSTLIWNQIVREYNEEYESAVGTFLNTLTAATDITLGVAVVDDALADAWDLALVGLQFVRGYDFSMFAVEQVLYGAFATAEDTTGRRLFPVIGPMNATGTATRRFQTLDLSGVEAVPAWGLASTPGALNNSWLFDPSTVHGWRTPPMRLDNIGGHTAAGASAPIAFVDIGVWGYKAFANSDIGGVRQVTYDSVA